MTRQSAIDQAVRRGFGKLYGETALFHIRASQASGVVLAHEHKAVLMAWDRMSSSRSYPSPTPKSAGHQTQHAAGGRG